MTDDVRALHAQRLQQRMRVGCELSE